MNRALYQKSETQLSSLYSNITNTYVKFQVWIVHNERDMDIQKIKVKKLFARYNLDYVGELFVYFDIICTNRKDRYSV